MRYQQRECQAAGCGLSFPVAEASELGSRCPLCQAPTRFVGEVYDTQEVHEDRIASGPRVEALLDNVRSLRNVGSMFRTADGAGVTHMHLGGFTPTPAHPKFAKTSLGAERSVAWSHQPDASAAAAALVAAGKRLWALEGGPRSRDLFELVDRAGGPGDPPIVLVLGHEVSGVDPRIIARCEEVARVPMAGIKGSLNVSVAFGVAAYLLRHARGVVLNPTRRG
ncbi:TrmH family RNA methyltransferase [Enhygromyxa salina]|uniref:TrmH family RNA methyltransferase n=1 Tax=Enhygromyxa salina TaxID=215803 RepID=UPI0015E5B249|nr:TrmH family RNA methyltransferase [Enhygromyxa salina]